MFPTTKGSNEIKAILFVLMASYKIISSLEGLGYTNQVALIAECGHTHTCNPGIQKTPGRRLNVSSRPVWPI